MLKRNLLRSALVMALAVGMTSIPAQAQRQNNNGQAAIGNLIAALVNAQVGDITIGDVDVTLVDASNVLRGADINVLNNALNALNVQILNDSNVIQNVLNNLNVQLDLDLTLDDVIVAVDVLSGDLVVLVLP